MEVRNIKIRFLTTISILFVLFISMTSASAIENNTTTDEDTISQQSQNITLNDNSPDLENKIINAKDNDEILIEPGTYYLNNITLTKNITLQGIGDAREIIIDADKKSSIFLIRNDSVYAAFKNITFINAYTERFGGAISMETGHVYVDNCIFINNTAGVNAGGISNYGNSEQKGYLLLNNSLFVNNHGGHDGGAVTTCYANSDIYNTVFINNSAHRDGGAIRVSVEGYGNVQDCIFMYNHADEWGGAYYSWSGESNIVRCIFLNNTAGTNGGAVMVSGNINLEQSIIVNNTGKETGGSFYIQQPMYDATTVINVHDNLITNNTSPYGKEIFIKWNDTKHLFTKFDNNDWGNENPNDSDVIDPDHVTSRSKVTHTKTSNLLNELNLDLLNEYSDILEDYFPENYFNSANDKDMPNDNNNPSSSDTSSDNKKNDFTNQSNNNPHGVTNASMQNQQSTENIKINGSNSDVGLNSNEGPKATEITKHDASKTIDSFNLGVILFVIIAILALIFGYKKYEKE